MRKPGNVLFPLFGPVALALALVLSPAVSLSETAPAEGGEKKADDPLRFGPVKLGLDSMVRAERATDFSLGSFSFTPGNDEGRVLFRLRPSVAVTPSEKLTARVEGQWYAFYDDRDFSEFTLYQGFVEGTVPGAKKVSLKAGRQEFVYGSGFLLGNDAFYDGLSFDAVKASLKPANGFSVDLFGGQYVRKNSGGIEGKLYGLYAVYAPMETLSVDLYGLRDTGGAGLTHPGGDHERTYSVGARLAGKVAKSIGIEVEPVYQFGRKNIDGTSHNPISACGGHVDVTIDPPLGRYPGKIFLSYAYGSGDGDPEEGKFTEFHNPNNDTSLIGDMNVIGELGGLTVGNATASGLQVVTVGGGIDVTRKLNVSLDGHYFRANKVPSGFSKEIGIETNLILTYKIKENISVLLSGNRFFTGDFFKNAAGSGKDIHYVYAQLQAMF
ncbi:alginate export family protein [Candidatus Deferrimicrobium sp.]|uniref:alginate export family protein n=1 Tax=Candidatus Deferrimicrobium sp. TaxID=3060586 RepID=UPI0027170E37|nr:alginate export family protein [Candidatus Deferrimicrobium sp.]MDO8738254.1 alginate export family protein [Candidatus Deferrimicrobium sp.]